MTHRKQSAFTLVELLVVIGIIALLISILLPALNRARDAALGIACASNMRQLGMLSALYQSDNRGNFLPPVQTPVAGHPSVPDPYYHVYLPGIYMANDPRLLRCPVDDLMRRDSGTPRPVFARYSDPTIVDMAYSYCLNISLPQASKQVYPGKSALQFNPFPANRVRTPTQTAWLLESGRSVLIKWDYSIAASYFFRFDHLQKTKTNVAFIDGHVEMRTPKEIMAASTVAETWPADFGAFWFGSSGATTEDRF